MTAASRKLRPARRAAAEQPPVHAGHGAPAPSRPKGSQGSEGLHRVPEGFPKPSRQGWKRKAPLSRGGGSAPPKWRPGGSGLTWPGSAPQNGGRGLGAHRASGNRRSLSARCRGGTAHARTAEVGLALPLHGRHRVLLRMRGERSGNCPEGVAVPGAGVGGVGHNACGARSSLRLNFPLKDAKRPSLLALWLPLLPGLVVRLTSNQQTATLLKYHTFLKYTVNDNLFSRKIAFKQCVFLFCF